MTDVQARHPEIIQGTTASTVTVVVHLHNAIQTVAAFWPIFNALLV